MGGDQLDTQTTNKKQNVVEGKKVHVEIPSTNTNTNKLQEQTA
jgi:hypothetical protein